MGEGVKDTHMPTVYAGEQLDNIGTLPHILCEKLDNTTPLLMH